MEKCYRSTPRDIGTFVDSLYQHPLLLLLGVIIIGSLAAFIRQKKQSKQV